MILISDADYVGEWFLTIINTSSTDTYIYQRGAKIAQIVPELKFHFPLVHINQPISETTRSGGLGSTDCRGTQSEFQSKVQLATPSSMVSDSDKCSLILMNEDVTI